MWDFTCSYSYYISVKFSTFLCFSLSSHAPFCSFSNNQAHAWLRDLALATPSPWNSTPLDIGRVSSFVLSNFSSKFTFTVGHPSQYLIFQPSISTLHIFPFYFYVFLLNIDYNITPQIGYLFVYFISSTL